MFDTSVSFFLFRFYQNLLMFYSSYLPPAPPILLPQNILHSSLTFNWIKLFYVFDNLRFSEHQKNVSPFFALTFLSSFLLSLSPCSLSPFSRVFLSHIFTVFFPIPCLFFFFPLCMLPSSQQVDTFLLLSDQEKWSTVWNIVFHMQGSQASLTIFTLGFFKW